MKQIIAQNPQSQENQMLQRHLEKKAALILNTGISNVHARKWVSVLVTHDQYDIDSISKSVWPSVAESVQNAYYIKYQLPKNYYYSLTSSFQETTDHYQISVLVDIESGCIIDT